MKRIFACILALGLLFAACPALAGAPADPLPAYAVVRNPDPGDRLNLRVGPGTGHRSLGKYFSGTIVQIAGKAEGDWYLVQVGQGVGGYVGYMKGEFLSFPGENPGPILAMPVVHLTVTGQMEGQYVYGSEETDPTLIAMLRAHTPVTVLGLCGDLAHIQVGGVTGFVDANAVYMGDHTSRLDSAALRLNGRYVSLDSQDDRAALDALQALLTDARPVGYGMSGCPFTAELTLYGSDTVTVQLATDSCRIFRYNGCDYKYAGSDNRVLFNLFGITP